MAITRSSSWLDAVLDISRLFFNQKLEHFRDALARQSAFRKTYNELSMLTDRDLADLGIHRSNIRSLAMEAANGL